MIRGRLRSLMQRRWVRRVAITAGVAFVVFVVAGFFVVPPIVRHVAETQVSSVLGRRVTIDRVRMNPLSLSVTVEGFRVYEPDGTTPFVELGRVYVNTQLSSVFHRAPIVREVALEAPRVRVVRVKAAGDGGAAADVFNFSDILARLAAAKAGKPPEPETSGPPPRFSVNNIRISDGQLTFDDQPLVGHHVVDHFTLGVPFVSTLPVDIDSFVEPGLAFSVDGTPFAITARAKPFKESLETTVELRVESLDLTRYVSYVPVPLGFVLRSAALTLALDVSFARPQSAPPTIVAKGRIALDGVAVDEKGSARRPLASLRKLEIQIGKADVANQHITVDRVLVDGLDVHARRLADGSIDWQHALKPAATAPVDAGARPPSAAKSDEPGPRFDVGEIAIEHTSLHVRDEQVHPAFDAEVGDIAVQVHGLSNARGATARETVHLRATPGGTVDQHGTFCLAPLAAQGTVTVEGIEPARFAPYTHDLAAADLVSGVVRVGAGYRVEQPRAERPPSVLIEQAFVELKDFAVRRRDAKDDAVRIGDFAVRGVRVDLDGHDVTVGEVASHDAHVRAERNEKGVVDLVALAAPESGTNAAAPRSAREPEPTVKAATPPPSSESARPWTVKLAKLDIDHWGARFEDRAVTPRAVLTVDPIVLHASNLSTAKGDRASVDLRLGINRTGRFTVAGSVGIEPLGANLRLDLKSLEILPFQPYFASAVDLTVSSGTLSVKGQAKIDVPPVRAAPAGAAAAASPEPPHVTFDGDIDVDDLASVDRQQAEKLVGWKSLHVGRLHATSVPIGVDVGEIALSDFEAHLVMLPDGHLNVQDLAPPAPGGATVPSSKPPPSTRPAAQATPAVASSTTKPPSSTSSLPKIAIGQIRLERGRIAFTDRTIQPSYVAELGDFQGRISGLSTDVATQADVDIHGSVNHTAALTIAGKTNPLADQLFLDLKVALADFELPPTSPYAAKYVGLRIDKGKLNVGLDYHIDRRKLTAGNRLVIDQLTFGEKVDSPDAIKLPVRLAVAILKDRHGVIDIDLPIAGSLDDPQLKIWPLVLKTLGNLVVKAVTAPFSLLASALGGGDEMSQIDFGAGSPQPDAKGPERMKALAHVLQERPGVSFEIEGAADPVRDRDGLRRALFDRQLKAQKLIELVAGGAAVSSTDAVTLAPAEVPHLVELAYKASRFAKPHDDAGAERVVPPTEQQKLLLANTPVTDEDLRALALRRATAVQTALGRGAPDAAPRLFLVSPQVKSPGTRVELRIKQD